MKDVSVDHLRCVLGPQKVHVVELQEHDLMALNQVRQFNPCHVLKLRVSDMVVTQPHTATYLGIGQPVIVSPDQHDRHGHLAHVVLGRRGLVVVLQVILQAVVVLGKVVTLSQLSKVNQCLGRSASGLVSKDDGQEGLCVDQEVMISVSQCEITSLPCSSDNCRIR